ncbi:MAG: hypothetical protein CL910_15985 [Deltaproteobacteria bacterium]|jgi:hypothetical protein|nr:hypothetical protein [Deltaproteobacteria bacterium]MDP6409836.1 hypothetical protein [Planctomycetota bacterium]MDP6761487.1 hypothetical protein [Planctomycetota bacterium]
MIAEPHALRVHSPAAISIPGECRVSVRVGPGDDLEAIKRTYGNRLTYFEIDGEVLGDLDFLRSLAGTRVLVALGSAPLPAAEEVVRALHTMSPRFLVLPDERLFRAVNVVTSYHLPVHVDAAAPVAPGDSLRRTADHLLYNPLLRPPVEPFLGLLGLLANGRGPSLWESAREGREDVYVDDTGRVALGRRWLERGMSYGVLEEGWPALLSSPAAQRSRTYRVELLQRGTECATCPHLRLCRGYLKALDEDAPCQSWQQAFTRLEEAARRGREISKSLDE